MTKNNVKYQSIKNLLRIIINTIISTLNYFLYLSKNISEMPIIKYLSEQIELKQISVK